MAKSWYFDVNGDLDLKEYNFIRRPVILKAEIEIDHEFQPIYFVGVHSKSKYINRGEKMWNGTPEEKKEYIKKSISNRRKIGAEWYFSIFIDNIDNLKYIYSIVLLVEELENALKKLLIENLQNHLLLYLEI